MLRSYNSFVKLITRIIGNVLIPAGLLIIIGVMYKLGIFTSAKAMPQDNKESFMLLGTMILAMGMASIWSVVDFYSFCATLNKKVQGIEFLKTSKRGAKFFMDAIVMDIIVRTFIYIVSGFLLFAEMHYFVGVGFREYFEGAYIIYAIGYGIGCATLFINRHFRNSQAFLISTYVIMMLHVMVFSIVQLAMPSLVKMHIPNFIVNHFMEMVAIFYVLVGVVSNILIVCKSKHCINTSWYND